MFQVIYIDLLEFGRNFKKNSLVEQEHKNFEKGPFIKHINFLKFLTHPLSTSLLLTSLIDDVFYEWYQSMAYYLLEWVQI